MQEVRIKRYMVKLSSILPEVCKMAHRVLCYNVTHTRDIMITLTKVWPKSAAVTEVWRPHLVIIATLIWTLRSYNNTYAQTIFGHPHIYLQNTVLNWCYEDTHPIRPTSFVCLKPRLLLFHWPLIMCNLILSIRVLVVDTCTCIQKRG